MRSVVGQGRRSTEGEENRYANRQNRRYAMALLAEYRLGRWRMNRSEEEWQVRQFGNTT